MAKLFATEMSPEEIQDAAKRMNLAEDKVPQFILPPLLPADGSIKNGVDFQSLLRPVLLHSMEEHFYGKVPPRCESLSFITTANDITAFDGLATRREISIVCRNHGVERVLRMLLYIPNKTTGQVPVFFGLNFKGNFTCTNDPNATFHKPELYKTMNAIRYEDTRGDSEEQRGLQAERWDFINVLKRGYASATICYYDIYPDRPDGFENSIMPMFYTYSQWHGGHRNSGAISAWAWGISRALDCLEAQPEIDSRRMIVHGHSRLGKTALWAGANDQRIALTVSNCSGTCGAKMHHRYFGETLEWVGVWNSHWMNSRFTSYMGHDTECPIDQHQLMALVAPRLLYVASATEDLYADPKGEFASAVAAGEAYRLFGAQGLPTDIMPEPGNLLAGNIGYYLRKGKHNFTPENWSALLDFADMKLTH